MNSKVRVFVWFRFKEIAKLILESENRAEIK